MGFTSINAQGLSAPPYLLAFFVLLTTSYLSDRLRHRGYFILALSSTGATGYLILAFAKSTGARYFGVYLAASGIFPSIALIYPWLINNQGNDSRKATSLAMVNLIGQCGPLLGTHLFPAEDKPYYVSGMATCAAFMFFVGTLVLSLQFWLRHQNATRDAEYGRVPNNTKEERKQSELAVSEADPLFRYTL